MSISESRENPENSTQVASERQKEIQREQDSKDVKSAEQPQAKGAEKQKKAVQTSAIERPSPPFPSQHLEKPSHESEMELKPQFMAEAYKGSEKLKDAVTIITGGDSGIGRAVAVLFAREGADVAIIYLNEHDDAEKTRRYVEAEGRECLLIPGDVKDSAFCKMAVQQVVDKFGKLDVLVNNAAFQEHAESLLDLTEERFDETMKTNVYGYFHMAKAAIPFLRKGASIINTGSVTGLHGSKELLDYSTTKGAIHAFTKSLASNLLDQGIRVNAVAPGPVWTPLNPADKSSQDISQFGADVDMRRPAQPEEISPAYVYLASSICSSYVTGIVLPITGSVG
ncbi:SDR family oxidoreductase [Undibacterium terreum]|uniref:Short-chain dehydrogenase n=1 Tax=Undibacterium terreum TaxID=1224302 RepID=A0A916UIW5_9BURK|nr:SDR family oxidoreductase [Undibacterium terreum]GGC73404.1 short-chain dehydrogenase [Undibacterium terreum]